jgi:hypothetical protein
VSDQRSDVRMQTEVLVVAQCASGGIRGETIAATLRL